MKMKMFSSSDKTKEERLEMLKEAKIVSSYIPHLKTFVLALSKEDMEAISNGKIHSFPIGSVFEGLKEVKEGLKPEDYKEIEVDLMSHERFLEIEESLDKHKARDKSREFINKFSQLLYDNTREKYPGVSLEQIKQIMKSSDIDTPKAMGEVIDDFFKKKDMGEMLDEFFKKGAESDK